MFLPCPRVVADRVLEHLVVIVGRVVAADVEQSVLVNLHHAGVVALGAADIQNGKIRRLFE